MIDLHDVSKVYQIGEERVHALDHVTLHIYPKEFVSVIGPSGSGKSTLMNIIGCLDAADAGTYRLDGIPIEDYGEKQLARVRNEKIGFIFQNFNLICDPAGIMINLLSLYRKAYSTWQPLEKLHSEIILQCLYHFTDT